MKTKPMSHQLDYLEAARGRSYFANLSEQGTGKTWMILAEIEELWANKEIECAIIIAPKGVHTNWVLREIPKHFDVECRTAVFKAGRVLPVRRLEEIMKAPNDKLKFIVFNTDAVSLKKAWGLIWNFANKHKTYCALDESSRFKTPTSARTKQVLKLTDVCDYRRIMSGTPITNRPSDAFSQFEFLQPGCLGTKSYRAFVARYIKLHPQDSPLVESILENMPPARRRFADPIIPMKDARGRPIYQNLEDLQSRIAKHSYRARKKDCLDLPEKVYQTLYFEMTKAQRAAYDRVAEDYEYELREGDIEEFSRLTHYTKLQQISSGFIMIDGEPIELDADGEPIHMHDDNPRLKLLIDTLSNMDEKVVIWALYKAEIAKICKELRAISAKAKDEDKFEVVEYHGGVSEKDREAAVDSFQEGEAKFFVGQPASGGIGLTLNAAEVTIYYSNSQNAEHRWQSEDRTHRIGTTGATYIDLIAEDSRDLEIVESLIAKSEMAKTVLGD